MEYVDGIEISDSKKLDELGYDRSEIADKLAFNYISQIIENGFFHADPFGKSKKFVIIKSYGSIFGMMGTLDADERETMKRRLFVQLP